MTEDQTIHHHPYGRWEDSFEIVKEASDEMQLFVRVPDLDMYIHAAIIGDELLVDVFDNSTHDRLPTWGERASTMTALVSLPVWKLAMLCVMAFSIGVTAAQIAPL